MPVGLSIRQPWVELILAGRKTIEVRTWTTKHRGELWLHASRAIDIEACSKWGFRPDDLPRGKIVGRAQISDCVPFSTETWLTLHDAHCNDREYQPKFCGWHLLAPTRVTPIPFRGRLGLMDLPISAIG